MSATKKWLLGFVMLLLIAYGGIINIIVPRYLAAAIPQIETIANEYINGKVNIEGLDVSKNLEITAKNIVVLDKAGKEVAKAPSVVIGFNLFKGVTGASIISAIDTIYINEPLIRISMDKNDRLDIADLLKKTQDQGSAFKGRVHIVNGRLLLNTPYGTWATGVQGDISATGNADYAIDLDFSLRNEILSVVGRLDTNKVGNLTLKTKSFSLDEFTGLIEHYIPVQNITGAISDLNVLWNNDGHSIGMSGSGNFLKASGTVVNAGKEIKLTLDGKLKAHELTFTADKLKVTAEGEKAELNGSINFADSKNPVAEDLTVEFTSFDVDKIIAASPVKGPINGRLTLNGGENNLVVSGNLAAPRLTVEGECVTDVLLPVFMKEKKLDVLGATAKYSGGTVSVSGSYEMESGKVLAYLGMKQVNLAPLAKIDDENIIADGEMAVEGLVANEHIKLSTVANLMTLKWRGSMFRNLALDVDISKNTVLVNNFSAFSDNGGAMVASGSWKDNFIDAQARLSNIPLDPFLQLTEKDMKGTLSGTFTVKGPMATVRIAGNASLGAGEILGEKFTKAQGFIVFQNNILQISKLKVELEQGEHLIDGQIDVSGLRPVVDINVTTNNVRIEPLADYFAPNIKLTGNLDNQVHIFGSVDKLNIIGKMHLWDGSCQKFLVDDIAGEYSFNAGALILKGFKIKALTTNVDLDGQMDSAGNLDFALDARQIRLDRIPNLSNYAHVEGLVDFSGRIKGTSKEPLFAGSLTAKVIKINGEELTGIAFFVESKGGTINKLNGNFAQGADGTYEAVLLLDLGKGLLQGTLNVTNGDVKSIAKMAKENIDVKGLLNGKIVINKDGKGSGISVVGAVDKGSIRSVAFKAIDFNLFYQKGRWQINNMKAQEDNGGFIAAQGNVDFVKRKIDLEVGCSKVSAAIITAFMENVPDFGGTMDFTAQLMGDLDNPSGNISMQISQGKLAGVTFDNLYGMVTLRDDMFNLEQLFLEKDIYKLSAYGTFPRDLLRIAEERRNTDAQMDLKVKLNNANLSILPSLTNWVDWALGDTKGDLEISGTLEDPKVNGSVKVEQGTIKVKEMTTLLDNFKMEVNFKDKQVILNELSTTLGKDGSFKAHGNFAFTDAATAPYLLEFAAKNAQIESTYFNGTINAQGSITQKRNRPHLTSEIRLDNVLLNIPAIPEIPPGNSNIGLDIKLELGPNINLHNKYMYDLWLAGGLKITGSTKFTHIEGNIEATKGTISYLRTPFVIKYASVAWPVPGSIMPYVTFEATSRFSRYNITAKAEGAADQLDVVLSSNPQKSQQELLRMLTLKTTGNNATSSVDNENVQGLVDVGLQMTFIGDLEDLMKQNLSLEEFRIYNGSIRTSIGFDIDSFAADSFTVEDKKQYNILISKKLMKNVIVGYTTSFDKEYHSTFAEYDLNDHLSLNFSMNEKNHSWYGVKYQIAF